jgi:cytochrome c
MIYYPYAESPEFPAINKGSRNAMAGPVFYRDDYNDGDRRFPEYYDGKFFFYDWARDQIMAAELDETGYVTGFERFLPGTELLHPMDMMFGPDGDLYILEYGRKWFSRNNDARLMRIRYNGGNRAPLAGLKVEETIGGTPFDLVADATGSLDYDGDELTVTWLLNDKEVGKGEKLNYKITDRGQYVLIALVDDGAGNESRAQKSLIVGNSVPKVDIVLTGNRSFYFPGEDLDYDVRVNDPEDGTIDPSAITVTMDYLEGEDVVEIELGHKVAGEGTAFARGKALIGDSDCSGCHATNETSVGPSYQSVADRYRPDKNAIVYLSGKIIKGGGGVWGERVMAAHTDLAPADAEQMARYILSLAGPAPDAKSEPAKGRMVLNKHKTGIPGRYYLQASYTDRGDGEGLPRLTTREAVVLRSPKLRADKFTDGKKVMSLHLEAEDNPLSDDAMDILVPSGGGWASYGQLDLSGISTIKAEVALAPSMNSGGTIEVVTGHPLTGKVVGSASIEQGISTYGINELMIKVTDNSGGLQPVYFRFSIPGGKAEAVLGAVLSFEFLRGEVSK